MMDCSRQVSMTLTPCVCSDLTATVFASHLPHGCGRLELKSAVTFAFAKPGVFSGERYPPRIFS